MNLDAIDHTKETEMSEAISSFTDSEMLHALTFQFLDDPDDFTPEAYIEAHDTARRVYPQYAPSSTVAEERRRVVRRLEIENQRSA